MRTADFDRVRMEIERLTRKRGGRRSGRGEPRLARRLGTLAQSLRQIEAVDFFSAPGGEEARQALAALEEQMTGRRAQAKADKRDRLDAAKYARRVWVTRRRPGVDRMSSAWLIRRFIDPHATFTFAARDSTPAGDHVAFDMFTGEFTHEADRCTFEVLLQRFGLDQPALRRIAGIVHDIDLKEQRYQAPEAPTIAALVEGVRQAAADDHDMLDRGMSIFEALYRTFDTAPAQLSPKRRRRRT